jgi:aminobenzoyl-glutamate transport protein
MSEATDTKDNAEETTEAAPKRGFVQKVLDGIEKVGDKVPHPAVIFLALCGIVIVLSHILYLFDVSVTYDKVVPDPIPVEVKYEGGTYEPSLDYNTNAARSDDTYHVEQETTAVDSLLKPDGIRFIFTTTVSNFNNFGVVGVILVAMVGVGIAEQAGLIAALIRKLVKKSPPWAITFIIVLLGLLSSVASDAGYLVLIPLGAAAFYSIGRHPFAGLAAAYAGVSAGFGVNMLITPFDGVLTEITNEAIALVEPNRTIDLTANLYFSAGSTLFLAFVMTFITERVIEKRLGKYDGEAPTEQEAEIPADESKGLRYAGLGLLGVVAFVSLLSFPSWGPLRNPDTGSLINDSPLMASLIFVIMLAFLVMGLCFGRGAGTLKGSVDAINAVIKTFSGLSGLIFLLLIIAQFIAYFNYSNMATVAAVKMADVLESANISALLLLVGFIFVTFLLNLIIPGVLPKWAIFAPVFVPLFLRLGVAPQTVLAAYRIGDSPTNVITPLMVYLPFIAVVLQRYKKDAGVGTVVSLMLPYTVIVAVTWVAFFVVWYVLGIPLGPGAPVKL